MHWVHISVVAEFFRIFACTSDHSSLLYPCRTFFVEYFSCYFALAKSLLKDDKLKNRSHSHKSVRILLLSRLWKPDREVSENVFSHEILLEENLYGFHCSSITAYEKFQEIFLQDRKTYYSYFTHRQLKHTKTK